MTTKTTTKPKGELIYGAHALIEMLKAKRRKLISIYTTKIASKGFERVKQYLPTSKMPLNIQYVTREVLDKMAGSPEHNGVVAWVSPFTYRSKPFEPAKHPFILMLDSVQDVRNLGAILRSASCIGVTGIVLCKTSAAPMTSAVFKASAGLAEYCEIYRAASLKQAVQEMKKAGYNFYMAVLDGKDATGVDYKSPACLVIGNEASGITKDLVALGHPITLPQRSPEISFNASVAAGILLFVMNQKLKQ